MIRRALSNLLIFSMLSLVMTLSESHGSTWIWAFRIDLSTLRDTNILETKSDPGQDNVSRVLYHATGIGRPLQNLWATIRYQGGLELYSQFVSENRMIHNLDVLLETPLKHGIHFSLNLQGRDKHFFNTLRGYSYAQLSPSLRFTFVNGLKGILFFGLSGLDYTTGTNYDYSTIRGGGRLELTIWPSVNWNLQVSCGSVSYNRTAYDLYVTDDIVYQWLKTDSKQKDRVIEISTGFELYQLVLLGLQLSYQKSISNNYGYSYVCPQINIWAAKTFPWNLTLRLYWSLYLKDYTDDLQPIIQIWPDTENEENNYQIIDLAKDINDSISMYIRLAWYKNESPFRDSYYEKTMLSLGLSSRF